MSPAARRSAAALALLIGIACSPAAKEEAAPAPGGGGGEGGGGSTDCADHASGSSCDAEDEGQPGGCPFGEVCAVTERSCAGGERCCSLRRACVAPVGASPGGARCEQDVDCTTGVCFEPRFGTRVCLRSCDPEDGTGCPAGLHCALVELAAGATTPTCLGGTDSAPDLDRTVCRSDADCAEGRRCRMQVAPGGFAEAVPIGVCEARGDGEARDDGTLCGLPTEALPAREAGSREASLECEAHGLCMRQCRADDAASCTCGEELAAGTCLTNRCTAPCRVDADCPPREVCGSFKYGQDDFERSEHRFRICQLPLEESPEWGCRDELDCCRDGAQRDGRPCCDFVGAAGGCRAPVVPTTSCRVEEFPAASGRVVSLCRAPGPTLALPGAPCATAADCSTGLCVADGAGGNLCSSPCEVAHDRCGAVLPGSTCCATAIGGGLCVEACRFDCGGTVACEPR